MAKPSLTSLIDQQENKPRRKKEKAWEKARKRKVATAVVVPAPPPAPTALREMGRTLFVRRFVTEFLKQEMNGALAYRTVRPGEIKASSSAQRACELLKCEDVQVELGRQLRGIFTNADLDEDWVYRQYRAMAHSNILDYVEIEPTGKVVRYRLSPEELTLEQQLNIRRLKTDPKTGVIVDIELIDRKSAVDSIAKARGLFREIEEAGLQDLAAEITKRMQEASRKIRTFDGVTGAEITDE